MRAKFNTPDLNSYGFWVLTSGISIDRYLKNSVLLNQHNDYQLSIGKVLDLLKTDDLSGEVEFDMEDSTGKEISRKFEKGYMNGFSIGIEIIETSSDKQYMKPGQTRPTVTKCELIEISVANIPSNANAVRLYNNGARVTLSNNAEIDNLIPIFNLKSMNKSALKLGLPESATEEQIISAIEMLQAKEKEATEKLVKQKASFLNFAKNSNLVKAENAESTGKVFDLDAELGYQMLQVKETRISEVIKKKSEDAPGELTFASLQQQPEKLEKMRNESFGEYAKLFKTHYGFEPVIN